MPHVIACLALDPARADFAYFQFPAWVEICRRRRGIEVPAALAPAYRAALARLPGLVALAAERDWDEELLACALAAIAAAKGHGAVAEAVLELDAEVAREFLDWRLER